MLGETRDPEFGKLAGDPGVAPARVLACESEDEVTDALLHWWPSATARGVCPSSADELAVPAQERLRRHEHGAAMRGWQEACERGEEGAIGGPQLRPSLLPAEHRELVSKREQFDLSAETVTLAGREQPEQGGEGEVGEGEQHPPILSQSSGQPMGAPSWETPGVNVIVDRAVADSIVAGLSARDRRLGEDARAAVEWLTGFDAEELPVAFSRRELQLFLWYQLPKKWLIRTVEQQAVAEALACFFDQVGDEAAPLAALCRSPQTAELIRTRGKNLAGALERSGLEPPDTPLLAWSEFMSIEEALEHDLVAALLEDAVDAGQLVPGARGWRQHQAELVERYVLNPDSSGTAPLVRIHAARRQAWLELPGRGDDRELLEHALATIDSHGPPAPAEAEEAIEPLHWLLDQLAAGVKLTQTGALPRVLVRAAVDRYPHWWDTAAVGPPYQEAELYPLGLLHDLTDELRLARRQRGILQLTPRGRALRTDSQQLLADVAALLAPELPAELDSPLARLVLDQHAHEISWSLVGLLTPFNGVVIHDHAPTAVRSGSRTLAAAMLTARAHGPRNTLG